MSLLTILLSESSPQGFFDIERDLSLRNYFERKPAKDSRYVWNLDKELSGNKSTTKSFIIEKKKDRFKNS